MKVVLAGAYGHLGIDIFKELLKSGHEVVALGRTKRNLNASGNYSFIQIDVTKPETLKGTCDGADLVISTVGLTKTSATETNYEIDYQGNLNLLNEAKAAGVKSFIYISVLKAEQAPTVPLVNSKYLFEQELKKSGLNYVIHRPSGYFYDIIKVFKPMIEKGTVSLLGNEEHYSNVISTEDFAQFIVEHIADENVTYCIGGKETYSYAQIAELCFKAAGKEICIKRAPVWLFDILIFINKLKKNGKDSIIRFSKFTLLNDLTGEIEYGDMSFKEYINNSFSK